MKLKVFIIMAAAVICLTSYTAPALAWTHGQFSSTTDACAGCHVAHAAQAPNLLKAGPTQTQFCFLCHGDGCSSAPYDVEDGYTKAVVGGGVYASTAGGFVNEFVDANSNYIVDNGELKPVTSRHNVWGFSTETGPVDGTDPAGDTIIPGGTNTIAGSNGFVCASCHDPHAGGKTPSGGYITGNPRLLRTSLFGKTVDFVEFGVTSVGTFTYGTPSVDSGVYRVTEYVYGGTDWCGACHNKFPEWNLDGHASQVFGLYRHPTKAHIITPPTNTSINTGTPPETYAGQAFGGVFDYVGCLTCHRAHSSIAAASGWASAWPRSEGGTSHTSALLRMDNRGICYNCHQAATKNCWNDSTLNCGGCHTP